MVDRRAQRNAQQGNSVPIRKCLISVVIVFCVAPLAAGGGGASDSASTAGVPAEATLSARAALGEKIFADVSLAASGRQACASCHDAVNAHPPANGRVAQFGGMLGNLQGRRNAPSVNYLSFNTAFHFSAEGTPTGGFFWDGRATSLQDEAGRPVLRSFEMANASVAEVAGKLARATYADPFKQVFGADIFSRPIEAMARVTLALQQYQKEETEFHAFSSKYNDLLLQYRANINTTEAPYSRRPGEVPALTDAEVDDVITFLQTLSDGYRR
jgi:cytochrome c peroxidase